jgi:hypothetical protein
MYNPFIPPPSNGRSYMLTVIPRDNEQDWAFSITGGLSSVGTNTMQLAVAADYEDLSPSSPI